MIFVGLQNFEGGLNTLNPPRYATGKWQWESLEMWHCVCHWVNTPVLFTFKRKLCFQLRRRKFPTHIEQTLCRQQCACADCLASTASHLQAVDCSWNVMAHAQKPDFVFAAKPTSTFKSAGDRQFSRLLAAEVCTSAVVMLDTACSEVVWRVLATDCIRHFPLHFPSSASPCAITFQLESTLTLQKKALYTLKCREHYHTS